MAGTEVKLVRSAALALFAFCGWKSSGNWSNDKLADKMKDVPDVAPEGKVPEDEAVAKTLIDVKAGIESNATFTVVDDIPSESAPAAAESTPAAPVAEESAPMTEAATAAPVTAPAESASADSPAAADEPKKRKERKVKGVRASANRNYFAGRVLFDTKVSGVSNEMIADLNARFGQANDHQSRFVLAGAYNAIRGYLDAQNGVPAPPPYRKDDKPETTGSVPSAAETEAELAATA